MKKTILLISLLMLTTVSMAEARLKYKGSGDQLTFDPSSIPANLLPSYDLMNQMCTNCHSMNKIVVAIQTGRGPDTKQKFDQQGAKAYCIKMLRKKDNVLMTKNDIKSIYQLLSYLL